MKGLKFYLLLICLTTSSNLAFSQFSVLWNTHDPAQFTINDLWNLSVINMNQGSTDAVLEVKIETQQHVPVLTMSLSAFSYSQGMNALSMMRYQVKSLITYGSNSSASTLRQTGTLPFGNYIFCASLSQPVSKQVLTVSCEERKIAATNPPYLITPYNDEVITSKYPLLSWHPPYPIDESKITYALKLSAIGDRQSPAQALKSNMPYINRGNLSAKYLQYTSIFPPLEYGKSYAWKIDVYYQGQYVTATDIWRFTVGQPSTAKEGGDEEEEVDSSCFKVITGETDGGYYIAKGVLQFAYDNTANDSLLSYTIVRNEDLESISNTPEVILSYRLNQISLELSDQDFDEQVEYLLTVTDATLRRYQLTFFYELP